MKFIFLILWHAFGSRLQRLRARFIYSDFFSEQNVADINSILYLYTRVLYFKWYKVICCVVWYIVLLQRYFVLHFNAGVSHGGAECCVRPPRHLRGIEGAFVGTTASMQLSAQWALFSSVVRGDNAPATGRWGAEHRDPLTEWRRLAFRRRCLLFPSRCTRLPYHIH